MTHQIIEALRLPSAISSRPRYTFVFNDRAQLTGILLAKFTTGQALLLFDEAPEWNPRGRFVLVDQQGHVTTTTDEPVPTLELVTKETPQHDPHDYTGH